MKDEQEGPRTYTQPEVREKICNGCKFLEKVAGLRSRFEHRDSYSCLHPDSLKDEFRHSNIFGLKGKIIHYNIPYPCQTPSWCPYLNKKSNEQTETTT